VSQATSNELELKLAETARQTPEGGLKTHGLEALRPTNLTWEIGLREGQRKEK